MNVYLSIKEAAELAGISTKTIRRYVNKGVVVSKTIRGKRGMEYRILRSSLVQHLRRIGYGSIEEESSEDEGETIVRLKKLVPRYLYDEVKANYEALLIEKGHLQGLLEEKLTKLQEMSTLNHRLEELIRENEVLQKSQQTISELQKNLREINEKNTTLLQSLAEKDTLIKILEEMKK